MVRLGRWSIYRISQDMDTVRYCCFGFVRQSLWQVLLYLQTAGIVKRIKMIDYNKLIASTFTVALSGGEDPPPHSYRSY